MVFVYIPIIFRISIRNFLQSPTFFINSNSDFYLKEAISSSRYVSNSNNVESRIARIFFFLMDFFRIGITRIFLF